MHVYVCMCIRVLVYVCLLVCLSKSIYFINLILLFGFCSPEFLLHVVDDEYHQWAKWLNKLWLSFGRQVDESVAVYPDRHSLLFVPKPFIVPGGRFREFYYWYIYIREEERIDVS